MPTPDADETVHHLDDGWVVHVTGAVEEEIGYGGGHTSGGRGFVFSPGMTDAEAIAAIDEQHARDLEELARNRRFCVRVVRESVDVCLIDEERALSGPQAGLLWPPVVTGAGLVVRWDQTTTSIAPEDGGEREPGTAPWSLGTEIQQPWFVSHSGEVRQLPFELAVRPLMGDAEGRLLLPNCHPLWRDGLNEPFTWIDASGATEPLLIEDVPVTPKRICEAIGEPCDHGDDDFDGPVWEPVQGRRDGDRLIVRLLTDTDEGRRWVTVSLPLAGAWDPREVEHGEGADEDPLPPL